MNKSILKLLITSLLIVCFQCYSEVEEGKWDQQDLDIAQALLASAHPETHNTLKKKK